MRKAEVKRTTTETDIFISLNLDGSGRYACDTGAGFFDHMLEQLARHGRFDLEVKASGDTHIDLHHLVEDTGIVLGQAFRRALGEMGGIVRYGNFLLPMDEALVLVAVDLSGRSCLDYGLDLPTQRVGDFDTQLVEEFLLGLTRSLGATVHLQQLAGKNTHHIIEAAFKGLGRALAQAVAVDERLGGEVPSTKGIL